MSISSRSVLPLVCTRAMVVLGELTPCMPSVRYLSSVGASLITLSHGTADTQLLVGADVCVQRLTSLISHLTTTESFPEDVVVGVFRIAKSGGDGIISPTCITKLLKEIDDRVAGSQFAMWKPPTVVASLHAIAVASPTGSLNMVDALLFCAKNLLPQLDERRTSQLLWCVASLRMETAHIALWKLTCQRLVRFSKVLSKVSRALVVEALLLVPECICDAQQELLCALQETRFAGKESDTCDAGEDVRVSNEYEALKGKLLSDVHLLPVESIVRMLSRVSSASVADSDEIDFLLQHLLRRSLKVCVCRELMEFLAARETTELTQSLRRHAFDCLRTGFSQASSGMSEPVRHLGTMCIAVALEHQQTHNVDVETRLLFERLIARCHDMRDRVWDRYSGRIVGVLAVALDVLKSCSRFGVECTSFVEVSRLIEEFPSAWKRGGVTLLTTTECAACVCSVCDLISVPPLLRFFLSSSSLDATVGIGDGERYKSSCTDLLMRRCTEVFAQEATFVPASVVFDMWRAAARVVVVRPFGLQSLMELLLSYTEQHPFDFSLRDVSKFIQDESHQFPAEAFELFVRCLMNERDSVTPFYLNILVTAFENVAARGDRALLERLKLLLFLRPLGHDKPLVHNAPFTTSQLVRLFNFCDAGSDITASIQSTFLELIIRSCGKCETMQELNSAASVFPKLPRGPLKDALAWALVENGRRVNSETTPDVQKALLIVNLQKGGVDVEEGFLEAMRRRM